MIGNLANLDEAQRMVKMNIALQMLHMVDYNLKEIGGSLACQPINEAIGKLEYELSKAKMEWWDKMMESINATAEKIEEARKC